MAQTGKSGTTAGQSGTVEAYSSVHRADGAAPKRPNEQPIFTAENAFIEARRKWRDERRAAETKRTGAKAAPSEANGAPPKPPGYSGPLDNPPDGTFGDLAGLAFSGGGVRSATFCLGVTQALNHHGLIDRVDYLSTVSGGGYLGSSLVATLAASNGQFVFGSRGQPGDEAGLSTADMRDTPEVGHLRNYSNYLLPKGMKDLLRSGAIVLRGLAANAAMIMVFVLAAAALTVLANPTRLSLTKPDFFGVDIPWPPVNMFAITLVLFGLVFAFLFMWAYIRSIMGRSGRSDVTGWWTAAGWMLILGLAITAFFELQPYAVRILFESPWTEKIAEAGAQVAEGGPTIADKSFLAWLAVLLAPVMAAVTFFRETLKGYLEGTYYSKTYAALLSRATAFAILWIGALALPFIIWVFYLHLSYWGIANVANDFASRAEFTAYCKDAATGGLQACFPHTPPWLAGLIEYSGYNAWAPYAIGAGILLLLTIALHPNAYSLHQLYQDRLSKAFLFRPFEPDAAVNGADPQPHAGYLEELGGKPAAPYLLVNTAINVISSDLANRRGRNADFFLFSPLFVGSQVTGYMRTADYRDRSAHNQGRLTLGTVMAISGAAASSNMGARTVRALSPTLAMLNVRLGYWLRNPRVFLGYERGINRSKVTNWSFFFLFAEMFGLMNEHDARVYLTDGGHIENLGLYELLRRRCKVIIVVDAEADPQMRFGSFITLQVYARIDLGIRIDLPIEALRPPRDGGVADDAGKDDHKQDKAAPPKRAHVAVGCIDYGDRVRGTLVYIKASMTGDENDYVRDYCRRNPLFPHESTGDQFFSEEQFEVYRALGFHAADRFFSGKDAAPTAQSEGSAWRTLCDAGDDHIDEVRALMTNPPRPAPAAKSADRQSKTVKAGRVRQ